MGTLLYGNPNSEITFPDRALAHLQVVIVAKLRRRESFVFSWAIPSTGGSGRTAIWVDPSITMMFRYSGSRMPALNRAWIDVLAASSNSPAGLVFTDEAHLDEAVVT